MPQKHLTVDEISPDRETSARPGWDGVIVRWVSSAERTDATKGSIAFTDLEIGGSYEVHRHVGLERAIYLVSGEGVHHGSGGDVAVKAGDALYLKPEQWHGFTAVAATRLITLYAPDSNPADFQYETAPADLDSRDQIFTTAGEDASFGDHMPEELGFIGMRFKSLIDQANTGTTGFSLGLTLFDDGGEHVLHRHHHAEEFLFFLEGGSTEQRSDVEKVTSVPGDVDYCSCGEWHGHRITNGARYVCAHMGAGSPPAAGYELFDEQAQVKVEAFLAQLAANAGA